MSERATVFLCAGVLVLFAWLIFAVSMHSTSERNCAAMCAPQSVESFRSSDPYGAVCTCRGAR